MSDEEPIEMAIILRQAGAVHPAAIAYGREGKPTVVDDGLARLELVQAADGWRWLRNGEEQGQLEGMDHLVRILSSMATEHMQAPAEHRAAAERRVEELRARWLDEADEMTPPRPWGMCAPGRALGSPRRGQLVIVDADHELTAERIVMEAERMHPLAHASCEPGMPTLVDDGLSWLLFFERWDGWWYTLDGGSLDRVEDFLHLQVVLAERVEAHAAASEDERRQAAEHVAGLSRLPFTERCERSQEHAQVRGTRTTASTSLRAGPTGRPAAPGVRSSGVCS